MLPVPNNAMGAYATQREPLSDSAQQGKTGHDAAAFPSPTIADPRLAGATRASQALARLPRSCLPIDTVASTDWTHPSRAAYASPAFAFHRVAVRRDARLPCSACAEQDGTNLCNTLLPYRARDLIAPATPDPT